MLRYKVVLPEPHQNAALKQLQKLHQGITRTKALASLHMWWPGINRQIEKLIGDCEICQITRPNKAPGQDSAWTELRPWGRLQLDFGEITQGHPFFAVVDATMGWIEAHWTTTHNSKAVRDFNTAVLQVWIATHYRC